MMPKTIEDYITHALRRMVILGDDGNILIPLKQSHLLIDINEWRSRFGVALINMDQLARAIYRMKKQGKVRRIRWHQERSKNFWELTANYDDYI